MGVTLEINFDSNKGTYSPGDAIQGTVTLRNDDVLKVKGTHLSFKSNLQTSPRYALGVEVNF